MEKLLFSVYENGELILADASAGRTAQQCNVDKSVIYRSCKTGEMIRGKYTLKANQDYDTENELLRRMCINKFGRELYEKWSRLNKRYGQKRG